MIGVDNKDWSSSSPTLSVGWTRQFSRSRKKIYFYNIFTGESRWSIPPLGTWIKVSICFPLQMIGIFFRILR